MLACWRIGFEFILLAVSQNWQLLVLAVRVSTLTVPCLLLDADVRSYRAQIGAFEAEVREGGDGDMEVGTVRLYVVMGGTTVRHGFFAEKIWVFVHVA